MSVLSPLAHRGRGDARMVAVVAALSLSTGLACATKPLYAFAAVGVVLLVFTALRSLIGGVALLAVIAPLEQLPSLASRELTAVKGIGVALALAWALRLLSFQRERGVSSAKSRVVACSLALWSLASAFWAVDPNTAISSGFRITQGVLLLLIAYSAIETRRDILVACGAVVAGAVATTVFGLLLSPAPAYNQWGELVAQRFHGLTGDPNELGAQLVPALTIVLVATVATRRVRLRLFGACVGLLLLIGVGETASRGSLVGLAVALVATVGLLRSMRRRVALVGASVGLVAFGILQAATRASVFDRLWVFSDGGTGRTDLWRVAVRMTLDHPLAGVGAGNFPAAAPAYVNAVHVRRPDLVFIDPHVAHNTFLQFFAEMGVVGGSLFILLVIASLRSAASAMRNTLDRDGRIAFAALFAATAGYLAALFFISGAYEKPLWILLATCLRASPFSGRVGRVT